MTHRRRRPLPPGLAERIDAFLTGLELGGNRDQFVDLLVTVAGMADDAADRLDLKITAAALREMREAFGVFAPYREIPKVTIFGSARTTPDDPLYVQTRELARELASRQWMVITGAGPGIMAAGLEGAGREMSFGINIRLPFEQGANEFIAQDPKLVEMKYFFTRKLMLMKESDGFVILPGGFGTLDETFELLTLTQTGKAEPSPIVLLEVPGGTYWHRWAEFVRAEVGGRRLIDEQDHALYTITDSAQTAVDEITGFYRNYHSRRFVGDVLVIRLRGDPTDDELEALNATFSDILVHGRIERTGPLPPEVAGDDHVGLPRIMLRFDRINNGRLRSLISALNGLATAPADLPRPASREAAAGGQPMEADIRAREHEEGEPEQPRST